MNRQFKISITLISLIMPGLAQASKKISNQEKTIQKINNNFDDKIEQIEGKYWASTHATIQNGSACEESEWKAKDAIKDYGSIFIISRDEQNNFS